MTARFAMASYYLVVNEDLAITSVPPLFLFYFLRLLSCPISVGTAQQVLDVLDHC